MELTEERISMEIIRYLKKMLKDKMYTIEYRGSPINGIIFTSRNPQYKTPVYNLVCENPNVCVITDLRNDNGVNKGNIGIKLKHVTYPIAFPKELMYAYEPTSQYYNEVIELVEELYERLKNI